MALLVFGSAIVIGWLTYGGWALHEHGRVKGRREVYAEWQRAYDDMGGP